MQSTRKAFKTAQQQQQHQEQQARAGSLLLSSTACMFAVASVPGSGRRLLLQSARRGVVRLARAGEGATAVLEPEASQKSPGKRSAKAAGKDGLVGREVQEEIYPAHARASEITKGLKSGKFMQGELRMLKNTCFFGSVLCGEEEEIIISGSLALNRAVDGDVVVVERLDAVQAEEYESTAKRIRHRVGGSRNEELTEAEDMERALEADEALSKVRDKRRGRVVAVVKRTKRELTGTLLPLSPEGGEEEVSDEVRRGAPGRSAATPPVAGLAPGDRLFMPADKRFPYALVQPPPQAGDLDDKRVAVVLNVWDKFSQYPRAIWSRTLGAIGDLEVETEMILLEHNVNNQPFSEEVLACLPPADFQPGEKDLEGRTDFRDVCVFSVDPPGCEDIDDALSCEVLPGGNFKVGIHIADVTHFVHPDTAIDREAADRCTSVYLVDRRIDMLPRLLTTDLCSLRADGKDRLTFSAIFEMTPEAEVVNTSFCKAVIRSRGALSYAEAQERLDSDPAEDSSEVTQALRRMAKLAAQLRDRRMEQGALELESDELRFEVDGESQLPTNVFKYESRFTNKLIEEFMLLANKGVAEEISKKFPKVSVLRRHPPPKDDSMKELKELLACYGLDDFGYATNKQLSDSLDKAIKPDDPFFNHLVRIMCTRCMNEALYFCTGELKPELYLHYGLAMRRYTHFTSPIRRYADVLVHRLLAACLGLTGLPSSLQVKQAVSDQVARLNYRNRMAQWADRASSDFHLFLFFKNKGPEVAEGVVMRVSKTGVQVAVEEYGAEGVAELSAMSWLIFPEKQTVVGRPLSKFEGVTIKVFDRAVVRIEADLKDNRHRKLRMTIVGLPRATRRDPDAPEASSSPATELEGSTETSEVAPGPMESDLDR